MPKPTSVRVRFAPSPTGPLHVGGVRTALFNYLLARHSGGAFILRLEDTDQARTIPGSLEQITASLDALGLTPDEGPVQGGPHAPYIQSERLTDYQAAAKELQASGQLYPCWCSAERLAELRQAAQKAGRPFKYDRHCLIKANQKSLTEPHVLRFKIPDRPTSVGWDDAVRGHQEIKTAELDDFVCLKSDGFPTYHLANVVDDHAMEITHVLRAEEWLPSTPKHLLLYAAFGWTPPSFAHLPTILGPDGKKKLSKRDEAVSVSDYLQEGYLPEALLSFLATLGWNDGTTQEIYTRDELIKAFSLERVQKSPAKFDRERLTWVNGQLIRSLGPAELLQRSQGWWPPAAKGSADLHLQAILSLVRERLTTLGQLPELTEFFFTAPSVPPAALLQASKLTVPQAASALQIALKWLKQAPATAWVPAKLEAAFRGPIWEQVAAELKLDKVGPFFMLLRVALTGQTAAPGLFETMAVLGATQTLKRLETAQTTLAKPTTTK